MGWAKGLIFAWISGGVGGGTFLGGGFGLISGGGAELTGIVVELISNKVV